MKAQTPIFILGAGAIGLPLAVHLAMAGRTVVAVRTSRSDVPASTATVTVDTGAERLSAAIATVSLAQLERIDGLVVVTSKSYANAVIAQELTAKAGVGSVAILQNGVGVERPFLEAGIPEVYRCVLYLTSQAIAAASYATRPVTASPIGVIRGSADGLQRYVAALHTAAFPCRAEPNIQREIWKKAIINAVFNSICPLLEVDNGVFARDEAAASLALTVVCECITLTDRLGLDLGEHDVMEQLRLISRRSDGQLISTLQDIRSGRPTEIASLNLEIARIAAESQPSLALPCTALLGRMIVVKSGQHVVGGDPYEGAGSPVRPAATES